MKMVRLARAAALWLIILSLTALADTLEGKVVGVTDGDTITVLDSDNTQHKIRLAGIDAPEKKQAFGNVSKQQLADRVFQKTVTIDYSKTDRYGRLVGIVLVDGEDINIQQIEAGLAWHYKKYEREQTPEDRERYAAAEGEAREARRGLWREPEPVAPWEFRVAARQASQ
jgi:endonuclease YncB( thermonuclease family)